MRGAREHCVYELRACGERGDVLHIRVREGVLPAVEGGVPALPERAWRGVWELRLPPDERGAGLAQRVLLGVPGAVPAERGQDAVCAVRCGEPGAPWSGVLAPDAGESWLLVWRVLALTRFSNRRWGSTGTGRGLRAMGA